MEINKLLTLMTSGTSMPMFDLDNDTKVTPKESLTFTNLHDLYVSVAPYDLVALDDLGALHNVKAGDYIIKSKCRKIYFTLSPNDSLAVLMGKVDEAEKARELKRKLKKEEKAPHLECCDECCESAC